MSIFEVCMKKKHLNGYKQGYKYTRVCFGSFKVVCSISSGILYPLKCVNLHENYLPIGQKEYFIIY